MPDSDTPGALHPLGARDWVRAGLAVLVALGIVCFHYFGLLDGRSTLAGDAYEYAAVARNVAAGRGIVTDAASVLEIARLGSNLPLPYFVHDPGTPLLLAAFFVAFGASARAAVTASGACFVLTIGAVCLLGTRLFGRRVGLVAAFLAAASPQLNATSVSVLSEGPAALLFTVVFLLLLSDGPILGALIPGLVFGALVVARQNALPFLPWILCFLTFKPGSADGDSGVSWWARLSRRIVRVAFLFLAGFCVCFVPNAARTAQHFGHPLHGIAWDATWLCDTQAMTTAKAGYVWRTTGPNLDPLAYLRSHPSELLGKMYYQLNDMAARLSDGRTPQGSADAVLLALLLLSLLAPRDEGKVATALRWLFCACAGSALVVGAAAFIRFRHLYVFAAVACVYAAEVGVRAFENAGRGEVGVRRLQAGALLSLIAAVGLLSVLPRPAEVEGAFDRRMRTVASFVASNTPADAIVLVESRPVVSLQALAWHTRREYVWYSDFTLRAVEAADNKRPVYSLSIASPPRGERPLEGLGPGAEEGFRKVAVLDHPRAEVVARLRKLGGLPSGAARHGE